MDKTNFIKLTCPRCQKHQITFSKSSSKIRCSKCNYLLTKTSGGKTKVRAKVREVLK